MSRLTRFLFKTMPLLFLLGMVFLFWEGHSCLAGTGPHLKELSDYQHWMSIYFKGQKVGYIFQSLLQEETGYIVEQKTFMQMKFSGKVQAFRTRTTARLDPEMTLKSFEFMMSSGAVRFQMTGAMTGSGLTITTFTGGYRDDIQLPVARPPTISAAVIPYIARRGLKAGLALDIPVFEPATLSYREIGATVDGPDMAASESGLPLEGYRIRLNYRDSQSVVWAESDGGLIREEGLMTLFTVRTTSESAKSGMTGSDDLMDAIEAVSVPASRKLDDPERLLRLSVRITGVDLDGLDLDGGRQKRKGNIVDVSRDAFDPEAAFDPHSSNGEYKPFLANDGFVQSSAPGIVRQARSIAGNAETPLDTIRKVNTWVHSNLEKRPTLTVPRAMNILETRTGDCNEHAVLTTGLLRALGIPARMVSGLVYFGGRFYYHAWVEAYYGRWISLDPLMGQIPADVTHIRLLTGGLDRQAEMVRLIGRLAIEILDNGHEPPRQAK